MSSSRLSNRLSTFRFSLRSPVSPLSPKLANTNDQSLSICHSSRSPSPDEKDHSSVGVHVVDSEEGLSTPRALPTPGAALSPVTPWHASFHRNAARTDQETAYLKQTAYLRYGRLFLSILLLAAGLAITALESDVLARYNKTHLGANWHLNLWPTDINLVPTVLTLIAGAITTLLALVVIATSLIPGPSPRTKLNNSLFTVLAGISTPLSLISIIVSGVLSPSAIFSNFVSSTLTSLVTTTGPSNTVGLTPNGAGGAPEAETIQSFTCAIANTAHAFNGDAQLLGLPSLSNSAQLVPSGFGKICTESKASLAIVIVLLAFSVIGCVVAGCSWAVERKIQRLRGEREVLGSRDGRRVAESLVGVPYEKHSAEA